MITTVFNLESKREISSPNKFSNEFIKIESPNGSEKTIKNKSNTIFLSTTE